MHLILKWFALFTGKLNNSTYIYIYISLFQDVKLKGLEFRAYALISFKTKARFFINKALKVGSV